MTHPDANLADVARWAQRAEALTALGDLKAAAQFQREIIRVASALVLSSRVSGEALEEAIAHMVGAGGRREAIEVLDQILRGSLAPATRDDIALLRRELEHGRSPYHISGDHVGVVYCCQRCGLLLSDIATRCARCCFLPRSPAEFALAEILCTTRGDLNLVVAMSMRVRAGETPADVIADLDALVQRIVGTENFEVAFDAFVEARERHAVEWNDGIDAATACAACGEPLSWSFAETCDACRSAVDLSSQLRGILAAHRLTMLLADFVVLDPDLRARAMLASVVHARDVAFFDGDPPTLEMREAFGQYWEGSRTLWNWELDFAFKLENASIGTCHHKGAPDPAREGHAQAIAREIRATLGWMHRKTGL